MSKYISLNEMRELAGPVLFGDDWIGEATKADWSLIDGEYGIQQCDRQTPEGRLKVKTIKPCPKSLASKLDRALGRHVRADVQYKVVDYWLADRGFSWQAERKLFNKALRQEKQDRQTAPTQPQKPGPKPQVGPRVIAAMEADIKEGHLSHDQLKEMPDKELQYRYSAPRSTVRDARDRTLSKLSKK